MREGREIDTLGLLIELRDLCRAIAQQHSGSSSKLHDLLQKVAHPSVPGLDKELTFRVLQKAPGEYGETLRTISMNGNVEVGRAAFDAAVRVYPKDRWLFIWGGYIVARYEPLG
jgi:hypothetical protein